MEILVYFPAFLWSWKLNMFPQHLFKCNFILNFDFKRFSVYLLNHSTEFFLNLITY